MFETQPKLKRAVRSECLFLHFYLMMVTITNIVPEVMNFNIVNTILKGVPYKSAIRPIIIQGGHSLLIQKDYDLLITRERSKNKGMLHKAVTYFLELKEKRI